MQSINYKPIVVANSELLSNGNITVLQKEGYEYIVEARIKNEPKTIKEKILKNQFTNTLHIS